MEIKNQVEGPNVPILPPWHNTKPNVNTKLQTILNKKMSPEILNNVVLEFISKYDDCIKCFTDGSITAEGDAGAGYYIPSSDTKQSFALSKQVSIFTAELVAIREILKYIDKKPDVEKYVILSDSLGVIASIKSGLSLNRPNLINEIRNIVTKVTRDSKNVTFVWLPSHINVEGNDIADSLAKENRSKQIPDIVVPLELKEVYSQVDTYMMNKWQIRWENGNTGREYYKIESSVSDKTKYSQDVRSEETMITRMRLGKCYLNQYLFNLKKHASGLCDTCHQAETIEHFLKHCRKNSELIDKLSNLCRTMEIPFEVESILSNNQLINRVINYSKTLNRKI